MTKTAKYLLFTFITSWIIQVIGSNDYNSGGMAGAVSLSYSMSLCMLMPTFGVLFAGADIRKFGWKPNIEKNIKLLLSAWLMPTVFQITGAAFYYIIFPDDFDASGEFFKSTNPSVLAELEKSGNSYGIYVIKEIFYSLTSFYTFLAIFSGLGEEIGWRGFLYPELKKSFGETKGAPLPGLFAFCIFTVTTGIISDYLFEKSKSIWFPAIFHGLVNSTVNPNMLRGGEHFERTIFGPVSIGLISVVPTALFAAGILCLKNRRESTEYTDF